MYWIEIRPGLRRQGPPRLIPLDNADSATGFRSVFAFDDETADIIRIQGSTAGLRGLPVYCDTIFMDFDDHDPAEFRALLRSENIAHSEYVSGNRSSHFHLPLSEPIFGVWVPAAVKQWTKKYAPTADISFLHQGGMFRLNGTYHPKNPGHCKMMVYEQAGQLIRLEEPEHKSYAPIVSDDAVTEEDLFAALTLKKGPGQRSTHLWMLATKAGQLGKTEEEALPLLEFWNKNFAQPPHDEEVLVEQLNRAYKRLRRMG